FRNEIEVVTVDPCAQKGGGNRDANHSLGSFGELHAAEPARVDLASEAGLQLGSHPVEYRYGPAGIFPFFLPGCCWIVKREPSPSFPLDAALHPRVPV